MSTQKRSGAEQRFRKQPSNVGDSASALFGMSAKALESAEISNTFMSTAVELFAIRASDEKSNGCMNLIWASHRKDSRHMSSSSTCSVELMSVKTGEWHRRLLYPDEPDSKRGSLRVKRGCFHDISPRGVWRCSFIAAMFKTATVPRAAHRGPTKSCRAHLAVMMKSRRPEGPSEGCRQSCNPCYVSGSRQTGSAA